MALAQDSNGNWYIPLDYILLPLDREDTQRLKDLLEGE